jgi:hypothetical protein
MSTIVNGVGRVGIRVAPQSGGGGGYTTRTQAFATATGIADTTILNALNTFDLGLISNGLDTKMKALYPFVGGTANTHKYNFIDTTKYQITWMGGITHDSNGIIGNGTNGYGKTGFIPSVDTSLNSVHISAYVRTNVNEQKCEIGSAAPGNNQGLALYTRFSNLFISSTNDDDTLSTSISDSKGFSMGVRTSSSIRKQYKNGSLINTQTYGSSGPNIYETYIFASNIAGAPSFAYSSKNMSFSSIGSSLTDAESTTFYNLVQAFQTSLSRQV